MIPVRQNADGTENAIPYPLILVHEQRGYSLQNQTGVITNPIEHLHVYFTKGLLSGAYDASKRIVTQNYYPQNWVLPLTYRYRKWTRWCWYGMEKCRPL